MPMRAALVAYRIADVDYLLATGCLARPSATTPLTGSRIPRERVHSAANAFGTDA
jgi:hypothetical protein